jgi:hypothetical protein
MADGRGIRNPAVMLVRRPAHSAHGQGRTRYQVGLRTGRRLTNISFASSPMVGVPGFCSSCGSMASIRGDLRCSRSFSKAERNGFVDGRGEALCGEMAGPPMDGDGAGEERKGLLGWRLMVSPAAAGFGGTARRTESVGGAMKLFEQSSKSRRATDVECRGVRYDADCQKHERASSTAHRAIKPRQKHVALKRATVRQQRLARTYQEQRARTAPCWRSLCHLSAVGRFEDKGRGRMVSVLKASRGAAIGEGKRAS